MTKSETYIITRDGIKFEIPYKCPHCNKEMTANIIMQSKPIEIEQVERIALLAKCTICNQFFALGYFYRYNSGKHETMLIPYYYTPTINVEIPENINKISNQFEEIYKQSKLAEAYNLNKIAGMGYRKSVEFLIKDYLIFKNVDSSDKILKLRLAQAIDRIDNDKIKNLAKASSFIGNDETHPIRLHSDKDISDLKRFLEALIHYIAFDLSATEAAEMIAEN